VHRARATQPGLLAETRARRDAALLHAQAKAFLGFGGKSDEEVYAEDTLAIIAQMRVRVARLGVAPVRPHSRALAPVRACVCALRVFAAPPQTTLALPKDDPAQVEAIARMRQLTNGVRRSLLALSVHGGRLRCDGPAGPFPRLAHRLPSLLARSGWPSTAATAP
jgi:hypothetical protein